MAAPTPSQIDLFRTIANPARIHMAQSVAYAQGEMQKKPVASHPFAAPAAGDEPSSGGGSESGGGCESDASEARSSSSAASSRRSRRSGRSDRSGRTRRSHARKSKNKKLEQEGQQRLDEAERSRCADLRGRLQNEYGGSQLPAYATSADLEAELKERAFHGRLKTVRRYSRSAFMLGVNAIEYGNRRAGGVLALDGWSGYVDKHVVDDVEDALVELYVEMVGQSAPSPAGRIAMALGASAVQFHMENPRRAAPARRPTVAPASGAAPSAAGAPKRRVVPPPPSGGLFGAAQPQQPSAISFDSSSEGTEGDEGSDESGSEGSLSHGEGEDSSGGSSESESEEEEEEASEDEELSDGEDQPEAVAARDSDWRPRPAAPESKAAVAAALQRSAPTVATAPPMEQALEALDTATGRLESAVGIATPPNARSKRRAEGGSASSAGRRRAPRMVIAA